MKIIRPKLFIIVERMPCDRLNDSLNYYVVYAHSKESALEIYFKEVNSKLTRIRPYPIAFMIKETESHIHKYKVTTRSRKEIDDLIKGLEERGFSKC